MNKQPPADLENLPGVISLFSAYKILIIRSRTTDGRPYSALDDFSAKIARR